MEKKGSDIRFAFFGTPRFATIVLDELERAGLSPALGVCAPDARRGRGMKEEAPPAKRWAEARGIPVYQPDTLKGEDAPRAIRARGVFDCFVVASYGKIIPKAILDIPEHGTANVHPSLLPLHRGASPIEAQILSDLPVVGVTIMLTDEEMDHGPLLAQTEITFEPEDWPPYGRDLEEILGHEGGTLVAHILPKWVAGETSATPQDESRATYCRLLKKEDAALDLAGDPRENFLKIRAYDRSPRAHFFVKRGGTALRVVATAADFIDGALVIQKVIPEGKREMSWQAFQKH